jgi:hypothetical protein
VTSILAALHGCLSGVDRAAGIVPLIKEDPQAFSLYNSEVVVNAKC